MKKKQKKSLITTVVKHIPRIDLMPAHTTMIGFDFNSNKSADISNVKFPSLCTPPIPPVTNTLIPHIVASRAVDATVVAPVSVIIYIY